MRMRWNNDQIITAPTFAKNLENKTWIWTKEKYFYREERYRCAVTHDVLNNATPVAVLKHTGDAVTVECVEKIIKKDMRHPLTGQSLEEKDIIYVQRGGTGYSSANEKLSGSKYRPGMAIA